MPQFQPWSLPRPVRAVETKTFTDPLFPDCSITLTLRQADIPQLTLFAERALDLYAQWGPEGPGVPVIDGGDAPDISTSLCRLICTIEGMQTAPREDQANYWGAYDLLGVATRMPNAWREIVAWAHTLGSKAQEQAGNFPKAPGPSSSVPPPTDTADTPKS